MDKFEGEAILWFLHGSENGISPGCDGSSALFEYKNSYLTQIYEQPLGVKGCFLVSRTWPIASEK